MQENLCFYIPAVVAVSGSLERVVSRSREGHSCTGVVLKMSDA
jgi:hypothetical protein